MAAFPPNPVDKPGYTLEFHDEFASGRLDEDKWMPHYLPQWSSRASSAARCDFGCGHLVLRIDADQPPWCPEYDGDIRCSSLQTGMHAGPVGSTIGQHRFNALSVVREAQVNRITYAPTCGYFEMRAKAPRTAGNHAALWMIGTEELPHRSAEICICELFGKDAGSSSVVRFGVHPFGDDSITDDFRQVRLPIDTGDFHVYAAEWTPRHIRFLVDNQEVGLIEQSPSYPMQFMLGLYERPAETEPGALYPKEFVVDYVRAWRAVA